MPRPILTPDQRALLGDRNFTLLFAAQTASGFGDAIFRVAQIALLLDLTGSAGALTQVLLAATVPGLIFALLGGALADRADRRRLLVTVNMLRGVLMLAFALLVLLGTVQVWHLILLALLYGSLSAFGNPAFDALLPSLVPRDRLQVANALFLLGDNVAALSGPALGGALLVAAGVGGAVLVNVASFFVLVVGLLALRLTRSAAPAMPRTTLLHDVGTGLRYARGNPTLLAFLGLFAVINVSGSVFAVGLPLFVTQTLALPPATYGLFLTVMNAGILLSITVLSRWRLRALGPAVLISVTAMGLLGYLPLALTREVWVALAAVAVIDALSMVPNVLFPAWVQSGVPDEWRGRVFGLTSVVSYALVPLGFVLAAEGVTRLTPPGALLGAGVLLVLVGAVGWAVPALRQAR